MLSLHSVRKRTPFRPSWPKKAPKRAQNGPRRPQKCSNKAPKSLNIVKDAPGCSQDGPNMAQHGERYLSWAVLGFRFGLSSGTPWLYLRSAFVLLSFCLRFALALLSLCSDLPMFCLPFSFSLSFSFSFSFSFRMGGSSKLLGLIRPYKALWAL